MVNEPINRMRNVVEKNPGSNDPLEAELKKDRERQLNTLIGLSDKFGDSLSNAFAKNIAEGKKFDNVLKSVRQSLVQTGLRLALAPLQLALSQSVKTMTVGAMGGSPPLDAGGLLGVQAGGAARPASITVNIATPDAESFRRSEAQVSAALARAVARGQRGM